MMRIALLSDLHLPPERSELVSEADVWATFEACLQGIRKLGVDLIVVGGDVLRDGKSGHYGEVGRILLSCGIPVHMALGNHDDLDVYRRTAPEELRPGTEVAACHSFDYGDLHVVILDSTTANEADGGTLGGVQIRWLAEDLAATGDRDVLVFMHHPPG